MTTGEPSRPSRQSDSSRVDPRAHWQREVPEAIRALATLDDADYADIFSTTAPQSARSPEHLVRGVLADAPAPLLPFMYGVQRLFLNFRLGPLRSPNHLVGWKIAERSDTWLRVETDSWFMTAQCVLHRDNEQFSLAAFVRYDRAVGRWVWRPVSLIHRQVGLALMRQMGRVE